MRSSKLRRRGNHRAAATPEAAQIVARKKCQNSNSVLELKVLVFSISKGRSLRTLLLSVTRDTTPVNAALHFAPYSMPSCAISQRVESLGSHHIWVLGPTSTYGLESER